MEIITRGVPPARRVRWPYNGDELTCPDCGTVFVITRADPYDVTYDRRPGVPAMLRGFCPVCYAALEIIEPRQRTALDPTERQRIVQAAAHGPHLIRH